MKRIFTLLLITFTLTSCSQNFKDNFPTEIVTSNTDKHQRIEGTKIYAEIPDDYKFVKNLSRYQKADNLYIQFIESNASNFYQAKPNFSKEVIESKGATVDIIKDVRFNDLDAVFGDGPSKKFNERKTLFVFGDSEFVVIVVGVYPKYNLESRNEIFEIFKKLNYKKQVDLDPFELANFEFDESITGFKYASTVSNVFAFTEDGEPEKVGEFSNSINIGAMPKMNSDKRKEFINTIVLNSKNSGIEFITKEIKNDVIGKYSATILESKIKHENKDGILYVAMLDGKDSNVIFIGSAFDNKIELLEKYKKTLLTIEIK